VRRSWWDTVFSAGRFVGQKDIRREGKSTIEGKFSSVRLPAKKFAFLLAKQQQ